MYSLKIQNANGDIFELSHNTQNYAIIGVTGLTPPATAINTATAGIIDGTFFNSARVNQRNIVITVVLNGDIEANRQRLYKIFPRKVPCTIYFKNANRNVKIIGYVETLDGDLFSMREQMQISIICPRPYFEDLNTIYTELAHVLRLFEFPFAIAKTPGVPMSEQTANPTCTIVNNGDAAAGCIISIAINGAVEGLKIINSTQQTYFGFDYTFSAGDEIEINTSSGVMGVILKRNGVTTNLLNYVIPGSTWFRLSLGENIFTYTLTSGDVASVVAIFATTNLYGGV